MKIREFSSDDYQALVDLQNAIISTKSGFIEEPDRIELKKTIDEK